MIIGVICLLAFWMGYSVNQGGTCAVATAWEILEHRRPRRLVGLIAASAAAAVVSVPLVWSALLPTRLAAALPADGLLVAGAIVFGIGAVVNDACLLGSLGRLGEGELRLAVLPAGLAIGFVLADRVGISGGKGLHDSVLQRPSGVASLMLVGFAATLAIALHSIGRHRPEGMVEHRWTLGRAMVVLGVTGGLLYVLAPAWTYTDLVRRSLPLAMGLERQDGALLVAATIVGAVASAHGRRRWRPRMGRWRDHLRTLAGGSLMGVGAATIPGGNDGLVLAAIPALSPGGFVAYAVMMATITAMLAGRHRAGLRERVG